MPEVVVETNVWAVADQQHDEASLECIEACHAFLTTLRSGNRLVVDDGFKILKEYRRNVRPGGLWWKRLNQLQHGRLIEHVALSRTEHDAIFSAGGALASFHRDDRKFVLVSLEASPPRPVVNAVDTDWSEYSEGLRSLGVQVQELCPCDLAAFAGRAHVE